MPRKKTKKYSPVSDVASDKQIEDIDAGLEKARQEQSPASTIRNVSSLLNKMSHVITAEDLGRAMAIALVKEAAETVRSQSVPASAQAMQDAHKSIMEPKGGSQPAHRYGRKPQRKPEE